MNRQLLEDAILQLDSLMARTSVVEQDFQIWFEANPVVFDVLGYQAVLSHPSLLEAGIEKYVPDFLAQRVDGLWEIIEIKRPDTQVLRDRQRRSTFYSAMETYLSQCREYSKYFDDTSNRQEFSKNYGYNIQKQPSTVLIAGRNQGLDSQKVHDLLSGRTPAILLQTYDDIRNQLEFCRAKLYGDYENLQGLTIQLLLVIDKPNVPIETFIIDIGQNSNKNRVSLYIHKNGALIFKIYDSLGIVHQTSVQQSEETFQYGRLFHLSLEVGSSENYAVVVIQINGRYCSESRLSGFPFQLDNPMAIVIGSDVEGQAKAWMRVLQLMMHDKTLPFQDKNILRAFIREYFKLENNKMYMEFRGHQFLHTQGHPQFISTNNTTQITSDFIQEVEQFRPIFRAIDEGFII